MTDRPPEGAGDAEQADGGQAWVSGEVPTSAPPVRARALAFAAIVFGGVTGAFIGFAFTDLQCTGDCGAATGLGALVGGVVAAGGVAVVAVLAMRAMGEWRTIQATGETGNWRDERDLRRRGGAPPPGGGRPRVR